VSKRSDIIDGSLASASDRGLVYTKKCGWIDLGHARPKAASSLWLSVLYEKNTPALRGTTPIRPSDLTNWFVIQFSEIMEKHKVKLGAVNYYAIRKKLPMDIKLSVALGIFMNVSVAFEQLQSSWPMSSVTDSGFSVEDLVSNLIGFYRAINPKVDYLALCEPVSAKEAYEIWDTYGSVGSHKNTSFSPMFFSLLTEKRDCMQTHPKPVRAALPDFINTIKPNFSPECVVPCVFARDCNLLGIR